MRHRVVGGIAAFLFPVLLCPICGIAVSVSHNGSPVSLSSPILEEGESVLVPIAEFGLALGIQTTQEDGHTVLRWDGVRRTLPADHHALRAGTPYATLEWMVGLVGGAVHRVGSILFVETAVATLQDLEVTGGRIALRFDGFVPISVDTSQGGSEVLLTLHHCRSAVGPQLVALGEGDFDKVRVPSSLGGSIRIAITLRGSTAIRTRSYEAPGFYSFTLESAPQPEEEVVIRIDDVRVLFSRTTLLPGGNAKAVWLYVEAWRTRFRLVPVFPATGFETQATVDELAGSCNAAAAMNVGCAWDSRPIELLILGGVPYALDERPQAVVGFDLFNSWAPYVVLQATPCAVHGGRPIPIDDVNRPIRYGEVVAYPPGYVGTIARGVPGSFRVIKTRDDRAVSVYEGPFVTSDPTATLFVASGEAKGLLSLIQLGDSLSLRCDLGPEEPSFTHAFSAGPSLIEGGALAPAATFSSQSTARAWSVLAQDAHGGLALMSFTREGVSEREMAEEICALLLTALPAPVRDAVVLNRCNDNTLVVRSASSNDRAGPSGPSALALCLVPLSL